MKRWLLLVTLSFASPPALAESAAPSRDVEIVAAGEPHVVGAMEQRLRVLLRDYPVAVHWTVATEFRPRDVFVTDEHASLARIWLDARASSRAVLYLVDDAHERFLVRVVPLDAGYDEVAQESVGTIVQSSVEALLAGASVGVTRQAAEEQVQAIEPMPPPRQKRSEPQLVDSGRPGAKRSAAPSARDVNAVAVQLGYRAQLLTAEPVLLHGPELGIAFGVASPRHWSPAASFDVGYRLPVRWSDGSVGASFQGAGLRAAGGMRGTVSDGIVLAVLLTAGLDWLHVAPRVTGASEQPRGDFDLVQPVVGVSLGWQFSFTQTLAAWLALGVERDVLGNHFDVDSGAERRTVLQPWPVLPVLTLSARWWP